MDKSTHTHTERERERGRERDRRTEREREREREIRKSGRHAPGHAKHTTTHRWRKALRVTDRGNFVPTRESRNQQDLG
jgi:hypothetical protein